MHTLINRILVLFYDMVLITGSCNLNALVGGYINLEYRLPNGKSVKFLDDGATYLGNQLECEFGGERCFGIAANMEFILVSTYEENGANPELVIYKKR